MTERLVEADEVIKEIFDLLAAGNLAKAQLRLMKEIEAFPCDIRVHLLRGITQQALGQTKEGFQSLWAALALQPRDAMSRTELIEAVLRRQADPPENRDFSLNNGERQVAEEIEQIRADHRARYAFAARWIRDHLDPARLTTGLDVFCGNGYGSQIVAQVAGARMVGIDGSQEAASFAEQFYGSHRTVFGQAYFPFEIKDRLFDFAISFESIEHIETPHLLLQQMAEATDGPFLVSVPYERGLPFAVNRKHFDYHFKHYTREEIVSLLADVGRPIIISEWGQLTYQTRDGEIAGLLPESEMGLRPVDDKSQFLIIVATKAP